jgi:hypothetical protein
VLSASDKTKLATARSQNSTACKTDVAEVDRTQAALTTIYTNVNAAWQNVITNDLKIYAGPLHDRLHQESADASTAILKIGDLLGKIVVFVVGDGPNGIIKDIQSAISGIDQSNEQYNDARMKWKTGDVKGAKAAIDAAANSLHDSVVELNFLGAAVSEATQGAIDLVFKTPGLDVGKADAYAAALKTSINDLPLLVEWAISPLISLVLDHLKTTVPMLSNGYDMDLTTDRNVIDDFSSYLFGPPTISSITNKNIDSSLQDYKTALQNASDAWNQLLKDCPCGDAPTTAGLVVANAFELPGSSSILDSESPLGFSSCTYPGNVGEVGDPPPAPEPGSPEPPPPPPATDPPSSTSGGSTSVNVGGAYDPNNLVGPAGYGSQGYIQPGTFSYEVDFENDPTKATAAAQVVTATFTLDPNLDPSTFQFTAFGFGSHRFIVPAGLSHYSTTIDLRPDGTDLLVPVTLDLNGNTVTVKFQSLDPATMLPPDGINAGFLPVDDANHDGEGFFTFTAQPKTGLPSGSTISEQASIVFDKNAAINTPTAKNTLDVGGPTSSVVALPAQSPTSFTVSWSGNDDANGAGVAFYDVFVSDNGGSFTAFQTATTATSATFTGTVGHTYAFYSVATDNVGHRQVTPTAAQATTTVSATMVLPTSSVNSLPATETSRSFAVSWSGSDAGGPGIAMFSVFVSDNGGPFTAFQTGTTATSATYTATNGHTYGFYSIATDTAGHVQPTPTAAQATTTVSTVFTVPPAPTANSDTFLLGPTGPFSGSRATSVLANDVSGDGQPQNLVATLVAPTSSTSRCCTDRRKTAV